MNSKTLFLLIVFVFFGVLAVNVNAKTECPDPAPFCGNYLKKFSSKL